ncbi:MAG: hypothetical protein SCH70_06860 [Candidatus Methanoperedens sp.]|nr:hypothetical protein [Candidatus Methanoperedens sp.]
MSRKFKKFQVWIGGSRLMDVEAPSEKAARKYARNSLGVERLPKDTCVCEIPLDYYDGMIKNNREMVKGTSLCTTDLY